MELGHAYVNVETIQKTNDFQANNYNFLIAIIILRNNSSFAESNIRNKANNSYINQLYIFISYYLPFKSANTKFDNAIYNITNCM